MTFEPEQIQPPAHLDGNGFIVRPITVADAQLDYEAVMETRDFLRRWERSSWPEDDFTIEANRDDMVKMQERHERGESFGYSVLSVNETECLGCVYVFSPDAKWYADSVPTALGTTDWSACDALIFYWVRATQMTAGLDSRLLNELIPWFTQDWPFSMPAFVTNESLATQVAALDSSSLQLQFEIAIPGSDFRDLAYV